jgi:hypothetical protein
MTAMVLRGRPIALRPNDRRAEDGVFDQLACNKQPRTSLAGYLTAEQLRRAQSAPGIPGRVPAPRQELSCIDSELPKVPRADVFPDFARGDGPLPPSTPGGPPGNPPGGPSPRPGPGPAPPGPPIVVQPPGGLPPGGQPQPPCGCPPGDGGPMGHGFPRTINFHMTGSISGGSATSEVRVSPRLDRVAMIRSIEILPVGGSAVGQYIDVLVSTDDETVDVDFPRGASIFQGALNLDGLPVQDQDVGLPMPSVPFDVPLAYLLRDRGVNLKVVGRFQAPAIAPPACHVVIVLEEFEVESVPILPRPPIGPPPAPPLGPQPPEIPTGAPVPAPLPVPVPQPRGVGVCGPQLYAFGPVCPLPVYRSGAPRYSAATQSYLNAAAARMAKLRAGGVS